jgi:uncharacterized protein YjbI with pentapeptide repeats
LIHKYDFGPNRFNHFMLLLWPDLTLSRLTSSNLTYPDLTLPRLTSANLTFKYIHIKM